MEGALFLLLVVLVNGGCILTFGRAQRALRDLGAAWVRALSTGIEAHDEVEAPPPDDEAGDPVVVRPGIVVARPALNDA